MISPTLALSAIPDQLRLPLLDEYRLIVQNYLERKWLPSELYGGRFCEIVYTILDGRAKRAYAASPSKPSDFPGACKRLENNSGEPRSFQILIPRMLPALYEIRNNRNVGHVGGDVDSNHMDATFVLTSVNWIMAELIRVLHGLTTGEAQLLVDQLIERRVPIIWESNSIKRVLYPDMKIAEQMLVLVGSCASGCTRAELHEWVGKGRVSVPHFNSTLRNLHDKRLIELSGDGGIQILPPGTVRVEAIVRDATSAAS